MGKSRREFIQTASATSVGAAISPGLFAKQQEKKTKIPVCVFTKCLQFIDYDRLGETLAFAGFDGADLPVRRGGYIQPENVSAELPKVVRTLKKYGLVVPMMVTSITDADDPLTERVLGTASELGIKYYRTGYLLYDQSKTIQENLDKHKRTFEKLAIINRKYNIQGDYQNHSGVRVGGPVWDLYWILKDLDPAYVGVQYDFCHAICEGGVSWPIGMKLLAPWIKSVDIKDFYWNKVNDKWKISYVPLGEGMVDFDKCLKLYQQYQISGPVSIHYEYDLWGAEHASPNPTMGLEQIKGLLKKDKEWLDNKMNSLGML